MKGVVTEYTYDDLSRVTQSNYIGGQYETFAIDDLGNRSSVHLRSGSGESYMVNNHNNRYTGIDSSLLSYDNAGNLTQDKNGYVYSYDYENRPLTIVKSGQTKASYAYDTLGRRIRRGLCTSHLRRREIKKGRCKLFETHILPGGGEIVACLCRQRIF